MVVYGILYHSLHTAVPFLLIRHQVSWSYELSVTFITLKSCLMSSVRPVIKQNSGMRHICPAMFFWKQKNTKTFRNSSVDKMYSSHTYKYMILWQANSLLTAKYLHLYCKYCDHESWSLGSHEMRYQQLSHQTTTKKILLLVSSSLTEFIFQTR
jgi:hypothetical protein